jgi:hypothetical protein
MLSSNLQRKEELCSLFERHLHEFEKKNRLDRLPPDDKGEIKKLLNEIKTKFIENRHSLEKAKRYHNLLVELCLMSNDEIKLPSYSPHGKQPKALYSLNPLSTFDQDV